MTRNSGNYPRLVIVTLVTAIFLALMLFPSSGTAQAQSSNPFKLLLPPEPLTNGGWRLSWESTPGTFYALVRWNGDFVGPSPGINWVRVTTVQATNTLASASDPTAVVVPARFYRVVRLPDPGGTDIVAPTVSEISVVRINSTDEERI